MISAPSAGDSGRHASGATPVSKAADPWWVCMRPLPSFAAAGKKMRRPMLVICRGELYPPERPCCHAENSWLLRVDQDERDPAWLAAAIDPGVVGALLPQHVAA